MSRVRIKCIKYYITICVWTHSVFLLDNCTDRGSYLAKVVDNNPIIWSYTADLRQSILCRDVIQQSAV
jgi:hypothetical protein